MSNKVMKSKIELKNPELLRLLRERDSEFVDPIINISRKVEPILNQKISQVFDTYTLHDIDHSIRVMDYMYNLITDHTKITDLDIALLILSALLHDVGMAVFEDEIEEIINGNYKVESLSYNAVLKKHNYDEKEALREFIRRLHGERSADFIKSELDNELRIPSQTATTITEDVANICLAHTKSIGWLESNLKSYNEKGAYSYSPLYCAMLLRLGDILDIDSQRTPPFLYDLITKNETSDREWRQHFDIHNLEKVKTNELDEKSITIYGECHDPSIHRKLLEYLNWINEEMMNAIELNSKFQEIYKIKLRYPLTNNIEPKGYKISDLKLEIDFNAISNLLMGENIYGSKQLGLRELVQNAIDACKVREEIENGLDEYGLNDYKSRITVILDKEKNQFIVKDNGIGMSLDILKKYFLNIGVSYYKSDDYLLRDFKYKPIGNFGIGFLACFMLSEKVSLKTKHINDDTVNYLNLEKNSPYISLNDERLPNFTGTEITLNYKEVIELFGNSSKKVEEFLSENFLTDEFDFYLIETGEESRKINNRLHVDSTLKADSYNINLEDYLNDIQGTITVNVKNKKHGNGISDIPLRGEPYFYDGKDLIEIPDVSRLYDKFNHCVNYVEFPILTHHFSDEYEKNYDVLLDEEEAIERIEDDADWITIFYDSKLVEPHGPNSSSYVVSEYDYIFDNLKFEDLAKWGQDDSIPTCVYKVKYNLYYSFDEKLFTHFYSERNSRYYIGGRYRLNIENNVYLKNVLIPETHFHLDTMWSFIRLESYNINITHSEIFTDVSRNKLESYSEKELQYALNKSICLWALNTLKLSVKERKLLNEFMEKFYKHESKLIKGEDN